MAFTLNQIPGFADLPDTVLAADHPAMGMNIARIASNISFGTVRPEFFYGLYKDGETVNLPTSDVDGYTYSRDELIYVWGIYSTVDAAAGWISGPGDLWYCAWNVDQSTGDVSCVEWYRNSTLSTGSAQSKDGVLAVFTIAQRQKNGLTLGSTPSFTEHPDSDFATDDALRTGMLTDLSHNSKFAAIKAEAIYMGEFGNGNTIPQPISPVDGHVYAYADCIFMHSWRWTSDYSSFSQPTEGLGQLHKMAASINGSTGLVSTTIQYFNDVIKTDAHWGRISVVAFCSRARGTRTLDYTFAELDQSIFFPGNNLPASIMKQIAQNAKDAVARPEFFGPVDYHNGDTVPLPTSPIDGYSYTRDEVFYIWTLASTAPETGVRLVAFNANINSVGLVTVTTYRNPVGSAPVLTHDGTLHVMTVALRSAQTAEIFNDSLGNPVQPGTDGTGTFVSASPATIIRQDALDYNVKTDAVDITWTTDIVTSYRAQVFPISDPGSSPVTYYVTVYDPTQVGDSVGAPLNFYCDTTTTRAFTDGYVFLGKIIATHAGGNSGSVVGPAGITQPLVVVG